MKTFIGRLAWRAVRVLAITLLASLTSAPGLAFAAWTIGKPIVTYWCSDTVTDAMAQQMADGGWNTVEVYTVAELDAAQAHGLRVMWKGSQDDATINSIKTNPALYSYFVADEPSAAQFPELAAAVASLRTPDPNHLAYINLQPCYASSAQLGAADYPTYLSQYMSTVHPSMLSYDNYQFTTTGVDSNYFRNLSIISHTAKQAGIPFLNIVQACSWAPTELVPTGNQLRYLYYTSLAYGAQGISDFVYYYWGAGFTGGMANADGTTTTLYTTAQTINPQFAAIAQQLQSMNRIGTYHLGDLPPGWGTTDGLPSDASPMRLPSNSPFNLSPGIANTTYQNNNPVRGAVLGFWGPDDVLADATRTLVVNENYSTSLNTRVTGPGNLSVFDPATGRWIPQGHAYADVSLLPGGGVLVGLTSTVPEPSPLVLSVTGLFGLLAYARRKQNQRKAGWGGQFRYVTR